MDAGVARGAHATCGTVPQTPRGGRWRDGDGVSVTVGRTDEGFYVADDGGARFEFAGVDTPDAESAVV